MLQNNIFCKIFNRVWLSLLISLLCLALYAACGSKSSAPVEALRQGFLDPPDSARPGVYWYFMDGNLSREAMTADLESMRAAGIRHLIYLEVHESVPRGPVDFLSEAWQELFVHAVREAERLGIQITLGVGPGWTGSGGPWVKPQESMQHLVASEIKVGGPAHFNAVLPVAAPRRPFFGEGGLSDTLKAQWLSFYQDAFVLAFPAPAPGRTIADVDEKALYYRAPYSSQPHVKPWLPAPALYPDLPAGAAIDPALIMNLSDQLQPDGRLDWQVPTGAWTILRFGVRNNGAITRPAPEPGLGFECDKCDTAAFNAHFAHFIGKLLHRIGPRKKGTGLTMLHMDSWEMGAQNWTADFIQAFQTRRGYDPMPYFPTYKGYAVGDLEKSERFLWDLRLTAQELVLENHVLHIKNLGRRNGLGLSIEPYDMNPCADLDLGAPADVPMCEFWSKGYGFNTAFSSFESSSIAHIYGRPVLAAEAFTADQHEAWKLYPGNMKNQGDWAFCAGINRFVYHTFAHKPLGEQFRPGMTMGPYGVHWDRGQTWWSMVPAYHTYVARCSYLLQQGRTPADVLYLTPEGAPHIFRPPPSAVVGNDTIPDRRGYNFDGCSPLTLMALAEVRNGRVSFPGGASYELLVLPAFNTMTPALLEKVQGLIRAGATIIGNPPLKSPSLVDFPRCDEQVRAKAQELWGGLEPPATVTQRPVGAGRIIWGGELSRADSASLYPAYGATAALLKEMGVAEDFSTSGPIRYTHRTAADWDLYFVANRENRELDAECVFRIASGAPEVWDPVTGTSRPLPQVTQKDGRSAIPMHFEANQSYFIVFARQTPAAPAAIGVNFPPAKILATLQGPWDVSFDTKWGGPAQVRFDELQDWTLRPEEGIKFYSGTAVYRKNLDLPAEAFAAPNARLALDLSEIHGMARVRLNGADLGVIWTAPWRVDISRAARSGSNELEIEVVNLWPNRLIGDEQYPDDGIKDGKWPEWLLKGQPRTSNRYTFTTKRYFKKDMPLIPSGLVGPVRIMDIR